MGSVEVFPGRRGATLADVWRAASPPASAGTVRTRVARFEDFAAIRALHRASMPHAPAWTLKLLESRLLAFPEGQLVAVMDGHVAGAASSLMVPWDPAGARTWKAITGDGCFTTHDPAARTLFCAEAFADPSRRGFGIPRALFQAQRRLCRAMNLRRILATSRLAGYAAEPVGTTPEQYAMRVVCGDVPDPALRFRLGQGFQFCGVLHGFLPEDAQSGGHAALLAWLNPLYTPPGPPAKVADERQRRCA